MTNDHSIAPPASLSLSLWFCGFRAQFENSLHTNAFESRKEFRCITHYEVTTTNACKPDDIIATDVLRAERNAARTVFFNTYISGYGVCAIF